MRQLVYIVLAISGILISVTGEGTNSNETEAKEFLEEYDVAVSKEFNIFVQKVWNLDTNVTEFNQKEFVKQETLTARFYSDMRDISLKFNTSTMSFDTQRRLKKVRTAAAVAQSNDTRFEELSKVRADMEYIYSIGKVCLAPAECLSLQPDITRVMATSRDYDKLLTLWVGWRNETGRKMKHLFPRYVELINAAVKITGYQDAGDLWRSLYETDTLVNDVRELSEQVRPLYEQLHSFVRRRLKTVYGESRFPPSGHIPAHILGDMWAQDWDSLYDLLMPFKNKTSFDVTPEMVRQNYTALKMFQTAEDFFFSLGFDKMVPTFWNRSVFVKPKDGREFLCHGSAWDFSDKKDFRIKMCTDITQNDLIIVHHEMGHVVYFMQYKNQPFVYREGANEGFHEAVGDLMSLSVQTPSHLKMLGLVNETYVDEEVDINFLMKMALLKVAFLPFGYLIDQWRWSVFSGNTTPETYNREWWRLRCELQGVSPPVPRSEDDFDPGAKYHIPANVAYLRYFISYIIQFQFHEAACRAANFSGPLHLCDIYNSKAAGEKLRDMLRMGSSKPWPEAMKQLTGQDKMDARPLIEYFKPLYDYLRKENGNDYGWDPQCHVAT